MSFQLFGTKKPLWYLESWLPGSLAAILSNKCRSNLLGRVLVLARIIHDASAAIAHPKQVKSLESTEASDSRAKINRMALDFASAGATHLAAKSVEKNLSAAI